MTQLLSATKNLIIPIEYALDNELRHGGLLMESPWSDFHTTACAERVSLLIRHDLNRHPFLLECLDNLVMRHHITQNFYWIIVNPPLDP